MIIYVLSFQVSDVFGDFRNSWIGGVFTDFQSPEAVAAVADFKLKCEPCDGSAMTQAQWTFNARSLNVASSTCSAIQSGSWDTDKSEWRAH